MADEKIETTIVDKSTPAPTDRKGAIAAAVADASKQIVADADKEEKSTEKQDEKEKEVKPSETDKKAEEEAEKLLTQQGRDLILALRDPQKAGVVIDFLAKQAGYSKVETKAEVKEAKGEILDDLKESLGEEFSFLADKLAPAIEKILNKKLESSNADIRKSFEDQEAGRLRDESASALFSVGEEFFGKGEQIPDKVTDAMSSFMDKVQPTPGMSVAEYVELAFFSSVGRLGISKGDKAKQERTNKNRNDASSRLASERGPAESSIHQDNSKPLSRQEAIRLAVESYKE